MKTVAVRKFVLSHVEQHPYDEKVAGVMPGILLGLMSIPSSIRSDHHQAERPFKLLRYPRQPARLQPCSSFEPQKQLPCRNWTLHRKRRTRSECESGCSRGAQIAAFMTVPRR